MSNLARKVRYLEQQVITDKAELFQQIAFLNNTIKSHETSFFVTKIIVGGFTLGFLLVSLRNISFRRKFIETLTFVNTLKFIPHYIGFLMP